MRVRQREQLGGLGRKQWARIKARVLKAQAEKEKKKKNTSGVWQV